jgi:hypothetical protein
MSQLFPELIDKSISGEDILIFKVKDIKINSLIC